MSHVEKKVRLPKNVGGACIAYSQESIIFFEMLKEKSIEELEKYLEKNNKQVTKWLRTYYFPQKRIDRKNVMELLDKYEIKLDKKELYYKSKEDNDVEFSSYIEQVSGLTQSDYDIYMDCLKAIDNDNIDVLLGYEKSWKYFEEHEMDFTSLACKKNSQKIKNEFYRSYSVCE